MVCTCAGANAARGFIFCAAARQAARLNLLDPDVFPLPYALRTCALEEALSTAAVHRAAGSEPPHTLPGMLGASDEQIAGAARGAGSGKPQRDCPNTATGSGHSRGLGAALHAYPARPETEVCTVNELMAHAERACGGAEGAETAAEEARGKLASAQAALLAARAAHAALQTAGVAVPGAATEAAVAAALAAIEARSPARQPQHPLRLPSAHSRIRTNARAAERYSPRSLASIAAA